MAPLNRYELIGKLTDNPELRFTPAGKPVASFKVEVENEQIATSHFYLYSVTNKIPVIAWGQLGEICNKHLHKGSLVYLEGFLTTTETEEKTTIHDEEFGDYEEDVVRHYFQVVARKIEFLDTAIEDTSVERNKDKILRSLQLLESAAYHPSAQDILEVYGLLKSLDFESID